MSDTPKTDELATREFITDGVWIRHARELERENAVLRAALKRWLKVADDCHQEQQEVGYSEYNITAGLMVDTRALLDAARKEAQP